MAYEYYVNLASTALPERLHDGLPRVRSADHCTVAFAEAELRRAEAKERRDREQEREQQRERDSVRARYTRGNNKSTQTKPIENLDIPKELSLAKEPPVLSKRWMSITVRFKLVAPWYSKDDRPFHVLDNPVRKDRVFGVPFMAATSWKGLLRWACQMDAGLVDHLAKHDGQMTDWKEPAWIAHLFGNERGESEEFSRGALQFFPTWFERIGFEVINPHSRKTRAGTQPIVYEVVPAEADGQLRLLYAPTPGRKGPPDVMLMLLCAIEKLMTVYGFSAKRTAGWGAARLNGWEISLAENTALGTLLASTDNQSYVPPSVASVTLMDESGRPLEALIGEGGSLISKRKFGKLGNAKPSCTNREFDEFKRWYEEHGDAHSQRLKGSDDAERLVVMKRTFKSLDELTTILKKGMSPRNGGGQ